MSGSDDLDCTVGAKLLDHLVDQSRFNQRFVALNVDDKCELRRITCDFGDAIRSTAVTRRSQRDFSSPIESSLGNAHIVRCNNECVEAFSPLASLPDVLQKRLSGNDMQRFARKTRRTPARWNTACGLLHALSYGAAFPRSCRPPQLRRRWIRNALQNIILC